MSGVNEWGCSKIALSLCQQLFVIGNDLPWLYLSWLVCAKIPSWWWWIGLSYFLSRKMNINGSFSVNVCPFHIQCKWQGYKMELLIWTPYLVFLCTSTPNAKNPPQWLRIRKHICPFTWKWPLGWAFTHNRELLLMGGLGNSSAGVNNNNGSLYSSRTER